MIGASSLAFQEKVESGEQTIVGVNAYRVEEDLSARAALSRPRPEVMQAQLENLARYKDARSMDAVNAALDALARSAGTEQDNVYEGVVNAAIAGATHGEIVATLRDAMGTGEPLVQV
jgi:methylmalonyl-CoA mutase N-terminal domain/subunit